MAGAPVRCSVPRLGCLPLPAAEPERGRVGSAVSPTRHRQLSATLRQPTPRRIARMEDGAGKHAGHSIIVATTPALIDAVKAVQVLETEDGRLTRIGRDCCSRADRFAAGHGGGLHGR